MNKLKSKFIPALILLRSQAAEQSEYGKSPIKSSDAVIGVLFNIAKFLYTACLIVAIIFIIIAGFNFLTAQADPEKIKTARHQIYYALIAIAVVLLSSGAAKIIETFLAQ